MSKSATRKRPAARGTRRAAATEPAIPALSTVIELVPVADLVPARINDKVYKPIDLADPQLVADAEGLRETITRFGIEALDALVLTLDGVIVSGHRRRGMLLILDEPHAPARRLSIFSTDPDFPRVIVAYNGQRVKSIAETIREEVIRTSPDEAYKTLLDHRRTESLKAFKRVEDSGLRILDAGNAARRSAISPGKRSMLNAAVVVMEKYRHFWPLTLRQVHYRLLPAGVLRNTDRPREYEHRGRTRHNVYRNDEASYKDLSDLLTRARLTGEIPWEAMHDPTRPRTNWVQWDGVGAYMREQMDEFLTGYKRNLLQSQSAYVELVVEKITVHEIAKRAAGHYHVPVGVGRGYTSVTSLDQTAERFRSSGKDRFILLIAGDFDPEGEDVCRAWAACLHDEHGVENITTVKVGVNPDQVQRYSLSPLPMKETSSRAAGFEERHGRNVYELEAFEPDVLQSIIRDAISGVLDLTLFAEEQRREAEEWRHLQAVRGEVRNLLKDINWGDGPVDGRPLAPLPD